MKKRLIWIVMWIIMSNMVNADDEQCFIAPIIGDAESYIVPVGDAQFNLFFYSAEEMLSSIAGINSITASFGRGSGLYDVSVNVLDDYYVPTNAIAADIRVLNLGDTDRDAVNLKYYLSKGQLSSKIYSETLHRVAPIGLEKKECIAYGAVYEKGNCVTILRRSTEIPFMDENKTFGEWTFNVEYTSGSRNIFRAYDSVNVVKRIPWLTKTNQISLLALVILGLIFFKKQDINIGDPENQSKEEDAE